MPQEEPLARHAPTGTFVRRIEQAVGILSQLGRAERGSALISSLPNCRYLTNFSGSNALAVITWGAGINVSLITDGRYLDQADVELAELLGTSPIQTRLLDQAGGGALGLAAELAAAGGQIFCEYSAITHRDYESFVDALGHGDRPADCSGAVERLRRVKDPHEIDLISTAASIADRALAAVVPTIQDGVQELEIAAELNSKMMSLGSGGPAFETIIGSGPNGALPHAHPGSRRVRGGEAVVIDFGAEFAGYRSDCTRTIFVAGEPASREMRRVYEAVLASQRAGIDALTAGSEVGAIDAACRSALPKDLAPRFTHATGHSIGLEVHEDPILRAGGSDVLRQGMVVTVEPGVYLSGQFGVRIEDTMLVDASGSRPLTGLPK